MPSYVQVDPVPVPYVYGGVTNPPPAPPPEPPPPKNPPDPPEDPDPPSPTDYNYRYVQCGGGAAAIMPPHATSFPQAIKIGSTCYEQAMPTLSKATNTWAEATSYSDCGTCLGYNFCDYSSVTVTISGIPGCFGGAPAAGTYTLNKAGGNLGYGDQVCNFQDAAYTVFLEYNAAVMTSPVGFCPPYGTMAAKGLTAQYFNPGVHSTVAYSGGGLYPGYVGVVPSAAFRDQGAAFQCGCGSSAPVFTILSWNL